MWPVTSTQNKRVVKELKTVPRGQSCWDLALIPTICSCVFLTKKVRGYSKTSRPIVLRFSPYSNDLFMCLFNIKGHSFRGFFVLGVFKGRLDTIIVEFNGQPTNQTSPIILIISLFFKDKNNMEQNFTININRNSESKPHRQHPYPKYPDSNFNWATLSSHQLELSSVIYLLI